MYGRWINDDFRHPDPKPKMNLQIRSQGVAFDLTKRSNCLTRPRVQEARQLCRRQQLCACVPATGADKYGSDEKVLDVLELLREVTVKSKPTVCNWSLPWAKSMLARQVVMCVDSTS